MNLISAGKRHSGKSKVPAKQRRSWQKKKGSKLKEHQRAAFFSPSENRCLPASTRQLEEREFVVDSEASMHIISKKDLNDAELDTLKESCSPTIVITANGEVQTHEEATVYDKELETFLIFVLENTPAILSLGKLCDENRYSYEWINGQKPHLIKNGIRIPCNTANFVPYCGSKLDKFVLWIFIDFKDTFKTGESLFNIFSELVFITHSKTREREDQIESDISPLTVSTTVDERSVRPDVDQTNKTRKNKKKRPR